MKDELISFTIGIFVFISVGICAGIFSEKSRYKRDTYDCTIKCADNAHSFKIEGTCYCKIK